MLIFIVEVEGVDDVADEPRKPTGRLWVATSDWIAERFQPDSVVIEAEIAAMIHLTPVMIDELGIGSESPVKVLT